MIRRLSVLLALMLLSACGNAAPADPNQALRESANAMAGVKTVLADVGFGPGAKVLGFELLSATGRVKRPADSDTVGKVKASGAVLQPELVTVGGKFYLREAQFLPYHELTGTEAADYPNAGRLLDTQHGVTAVLPKGKGAAISGSEPVDGHDCTRVTASYSPDALNDALAPIKLTDDVRATLWIDKESKLIRRVKFVGHLFDPATDSFVDVRLHDFNATVDIASPF
ncbi:MAG: LppX_LprAFG lipoprotein [Candidatus Dormibacteria bacterium]